MPEPQQFEFTDAEGKKWTLPFASGAAEHLTGQDLRDAVIDGQNVTYLIKSAEAVTDKETLKALYALPQKKMVEILDAWAEHGDGDGSNLGE